jgi:hypothetical protein
LHPTKIFKTNNCHGFSTWDKYLSTG